MAPVPPISNSNVGSNLTLDDAAIAGTLIGYVWYRSGTTSVTKGVPIPQSFTTNGAYTIRDEDLGHYLIPCTISWDGAEVRSYGTAIGPIDDLSPWPMDADGSGGQFRLHCTTNRDNLSALEEGVTILGHPGNTDAGLSALRKMANHYNRSQAYVVGNSTNSGWQYNLGPAYDLLTSGACHMLVIGDSRYVQGGPMWQGWFANWKPPGGWSGFLVSPSLSAGGTLLNFAGTQSGNYSMPCIANSSAMAGADGTPTVSGGNAPSGQAVTIYSQTDPTKWSTRAVLPGYNNPTILPCYVYVWTGTPTSWGVLNGCWIGPMGQSMLGPCWASGDWITGKTLGQIKVGQIYMKHADVPAGSAFDFEVWEGQGNTTGSGTAGSFAAITFGTTTAGQLDIQYTNVATNLMNTPFGNSTASGVNYPGPTQCPVYFQYLGIGTPSPGFKMTASTADPRLTAAGKADWTGCWRLENWCKNTTNLNGKKLVWYGFCIEDTTATSGLFITDVAASGATLRWWVDGSTTAQLASTLTYRSSDPVKLVWLGLGENHTASEWDGSNVSSTQLRTDVLANLQRIWDAADSAGITRPFTILDSPPSNVGGAKPKSYYTALDTVCRQLAKDYPHLVGHLSTYQWAEDMYPTDASRYSASVPYQAIAAGGDDMLWANPLFRDGVHYSYIGAWAVTKFQFEQIMHPIDA